MNQKISPFLPTFTPMSIVNAADIKKLTRVKLFKEICRTYGPPPNWSRPPGFVSLSKIILEQQVSLASAHAHFTKLNAYLPAFNPTHILTLTDAEMRECQISRQKATYLRELAKAVVDKKLDIDQLKGLPATEVRKQLTAIKGIGNWTTDIYQMFCLQEKDIFPLGDIAVINTVRELTAAQTKEEIVLLSEKWKPLRSLATYFLWHYYLAKRGRAVP
jgi:DNA-3-methyladenine glycosylase II